METKKAIDAAYLVHVRGCLQFCEDITPMRKCQSLVLRCFSPVKQCTLKLSYKPLLKKTLDQTLQVSLSHLVPIITDVDNAVVDTRKPSLMGNGPWISYHALRQKHLYLTLSCCLGNPWVHRSQYRPTNHRRIKQIIWDARSKRNLKIRSFNIQNLKL